MGEALRAKLRARAAERLFDAWAENGEPWCLHKIYRVVCPMQWREYMRLLYGNFMRSACQYDDVRKMSDHTTTLFFRATAILAEHILFYIIAMHAPSSIIRYFRLRLMVHGSSYQGRYFCFRLGIGAKTDIFVFDWW